MKLWPHFTKVVSISALLAVCVLALTPSARAQPTIDADAQGVLGAVSNYLGGLKSFSVDYFAVDEVITPEGQKLQFLHSGEIMVQRPDKLHVTRSRHRRGVPRRQSTNSVLERRQRVFET